MKLPESMPIVNAMEPIVINFFDDYIKTHMLQCDCNKCKLDIIVLTLNHVPPKYTSSQTGEAYIKALFMNPQLQSDVLREITQAVKVIEQNPNH